MAQLDQAALTSFSDLASQHVIMKLLPCLCTVREVTDLVVSASFFSSAGMKNRSLGEGIANLSKYRSPLTNSESPTSLVSTSGDFSLSFSTISASSLLRSFSSAGNGV